MMNNIIYHVTKPHFKSVYEDLKLLQKVLDSNILFDEVTITSIEDKHE